MYFFTSRLDLPARGEQRLFEVPPDIFDRMEMVGLKAGRRTDGFDRFSEALRVIREGRSHMEAEVFSLLQKLPGIIPMLRRCFMGHQDAIMLVFDHHHTVVCTQRVGAVTRTLRHWGEGKQVLQHLIGGGKFEPMSSIQRLIDDLVIGIRNRAEKRSAMCLRLTPQTTARSQAKRITLWLIC